MIIGFTGTQKGMTLFQKEYLVKILKLKECSEFVHGDCIGADEEANNIAMNECGISIFTIHPPLHDYKRAYCFNKKKMHPPTMQYLVLPETHLMYKKDIKVKWMEPFKYLERNKHIVDSVTLMIAAPKEHTHAIRSGTWATIRYAWKTKKDIIIIPPIERPDDSFYETNSKTD